MPDDMQPRRFIRTLLLPPPYCRLLGAAAHAGRHPHCNRTRLGPSAHGAVAMNVLIRH
jgi:hypothetical protein